MAVFGHLTSLLLAFVLIKESAAQVFSYLMDVLGGFLSGPNAAGGAVFVLPASLFLLLVFILFIVVGCQLPALIVTKLIMDRDR